MLSSGAIGWMFAVIGGAMTLASAVFCWRALRLTVFGTRTEGVVVGRELSKAERRGPGVAWHPKVRFTTADGREITFTAQAARTAPPADGSSITVVYDPKQPDRASLGGFAEVWMLPLLLALFGVPFALIGLSMLMPAP